MIIKLLSHKMFNKQNNFIVLNNGFHMPVISVGTYQIKSKKEIFAVVDSALSLGYRSFDTARVYGNEGHLGSALQRLLSKYNLSRKDVFITSKLGTLDHGTEACKRACLESLQQLQCTYIDLYLIHWPGVQGLKVDDERNSLLRRQSWEQMEEMCSKGFLRGIGVSNYTTLHLTQLLQHCTIKPVLLQSECHPHLRQTHVRRLCEEHNIAFQAYSSLGTSTTDNELQRDARVREVAAQTARSVSQVLLRWALQQNIGVIPKSTNVEHMADNMASLDFLLSHEHMHALSNIDLHKHYCWDPTSVV